MNYLVVIDTNVLYPLYYPNIVMRQRFRCLMLFLTEQLFLYSMMRFLQNMIMYFTVQSLSSRIQTFNYS